MYRRLTKTVTFLPQLGLVATSRSLTDLGISQSVRLSSIPCYFKQVIPPSSSDDDNRIILRPLEDLVDCQRDFINASYVDVSEGNSI